MTGATGHNFLPGFSVILGKAEVKVKLDRASSWPCPQPSLVKMSSGSPQALAKWDRDPGHLHPLGKQVILLRKGTW